MPSASPSRPPSRPATRPNGQQPPLRNFERCDWDSRGWHSSPVKQEAGSPCLNAKLLATATCMSVCQCMSVYALFVSYAFFLPWPRCYLCLWTLTSGLACMAETQSAHPWWHCQLRGRCPEAQVNEKRRQFPSQHFHCFNIAFHHV